MPSETSQCSEISAGTQTACSGRVILPRQYRMEAHSVSMISGRSCIGLRFAFHTLTTSYRCQCYLSLCRHRLTVAESSHRRISPSSSTFQLTSGLMVESRIAHMPSSSYSTHTGHLPSTHLKEKGPSSMAANPSS